MEIIQGGNSKNFKNDSVLDIATCVNSYGPPDILDEISGIIKHSCKLKKHPFNCLDEFSFFYSEYLNVNKDELVIGRGITELIHAIRLSYLRDLHIENCIADIIGALRGEYCSDFLYPSPDYTDLLLGFKKGPDIKDFNIESRVEQIEKCAHLSKAVIFSNPCNPTGLTVPTNRLMQIFQKHPDTFFVIDESYADFTLSPKEWSVLGAPYSNIAVLRSPTKCFGMGGIRVGAAWIPNDNIRIKTQEQICKWPLSTFDVEFAVSAMTKTDWLKETKQNLLETASEMEQLLIDFGLNPITDVPVHFRFVVEENAQMISGRLLNHGLATRAKSKREGVSGIRFVAPQKKDMVTVKKIFEAVFR